MNSTTDIILFETYAIGIFGKFPIIKGSFHMAFDLSYISSVGTLIVTFKGNIV